MMSDSEEAARSRPKRIVLVDDSALYAEAWRAVFHSRYGERVAFEAYQDPVEALRHFAADVDLLLLDLEMPVLDGRKLAVMAEQRGIACRRIVILSAHSADELHELFPPSSCLAVINKTEPKQQQAFLMILDSVMKR
ncbi:MAG: response regulator [Acidobacteria bacterium]|nr:MAG: response regulator [Acidobacteriota bacterium]